MHFPSHKLPSKRRDHVRRYCQRSEGGGERVGVAELPQLHMEGAEAVQRDAHLPGTILNESDNVRRLLSCRRRRRLCSSRARARRRRATAVVGAGAGAPAGNCHRRTPNATQAQVSVHGVGVRGAGSHVCGRVWQQWQRKKWQRRRAQRQW